MISNDNKSQRETLRRSSAKTDNIDVFRDQDAVDRLRGHNSLVVGHRQVPQHGESRSQSVILLLVF